MLVWVGRGSYLWTTAPWALHCTAYHHITSYLLQQLHFTSLQHCRFISIIISKKTTAPLKSPPLHPHLTTDCSSPAHHATLELHLRADKSQANSFCFSGHLRICTVWREGKHLLLEAMIGRITLDTHYRHTLGSSWRKLGWVRSQEEENWTKNLQMASNTEFRVMIKTMFSRYKMFCFSHHIIAPLLRVCSPARDVEMVHLWHFCPNCGLWGGPLVHRGADPHLTTTTPVPAACTSAPPPPPPPPLLLQHRLTRHCSTAALQQCLGIDPKSQDGHQMAAL